MISTRCATSSPAPSGCGTRPAGPMPRSSACASSKAMARPRRRPVIAVNTPMHYQAGHRRPPAARRSRRGSMPVPGIDEGGRLSIRGPQHHGRLSRGRRARACCSRPRTAGTIPATSSRSTSAGFVTIRGRAKRFAKIGGEMVSLPAVEGYAAALWPQADACRGHPRRPAQGRAARPVHHRRRAPSATALQAWARARTASPN